MKQRKLRYRLLGKLLRWGGYCALLVGELLDPREREGGTGATKEDS